MWSREILLLRSKVTIQYVDVTEDGFRLHSQGAEGDYELVDAADDHFVPRHGDVEYRNLAELDLLENQLPFFSSSFTPNSRRCPKWVALQVGLPVVCWSLIIESMKLKDTEMMKSKHMSPHIVLGDLRTTWLCLLSMQKLRDGFTQLQALISSHFPGRWKDQLVELPISAISFWKPVALPGGLSNLGLVRGIFESIFALPSGFLADRLPRPALIFMGSIIWAAGLIGCAFSPDRPKSQVMSGWQVFLI